jgi:ribosomal protein L13E
MVILKLELLSILHLISSLSIPYTRKLPSYKTSHNSNSNISVSIIIDQPFWFRFQLKHTTYKAYTTVATSSKVLGSKELKKKGIERQTEIVAEICQNRRADKDRFFRGFSVAQIEKYKTNKSLEITWGMCTRNRRSKRYSENFHEFLQYSMKISFMTTTSPNPTSLKLEVLLGTTTK